MTLLWIDLETTGLNPETDLILEVGIIITDHTLQWRTQAAWTVGYLNPMERSRILHASDSANPNNPNKFVAEMHEKNGLWKDVLWCQDELETVEQYITRWLIEHCPRDEMDDLLPLHPAGSSVHFDVDFMRYHMPMVAKMFHHRHFDVSSVKMYYEVLEGGYDKGPEDEHRALSDLKNDIEWIQSKVFDYTRMAEFYRLAEGTEK